MRLLSGFRLVLLCASLVSLGSLLAQTSTSAPAPQPPKPGAAKPPEPVKIVEIPATAPSLVDAKPYIRRFTFGGTLSFLPLSLITGGKKSEVYGTPPVSIESQADNKSSYFGVGLDMEAAITDHFAVSIGVLWRRAGYRLTTKLHDKVDNPATPEDERTLLKTTTEETKANYYDFPMMVKWYNKSRYEPGWRYFYEVGPSLRTVSGIRTAVQTETATEFTCCDETPATPATKNLFGVTAGAGIVLRDDFNIKIIPEVRYTRWFGGTFDTRAVNSRRDQVDASITFRF